MSDGNETSQVSDDRVKQNKKNVRKGSKLEVACRNAIRDMGFVAARTVPCSGSLVTLRAALPWAKVGGN